MKRYHIVYQGLVQGVGFRFQLLQIARELGLTGWVRNAGANVEAEVQGEKVDEFLKKTLQKRGFAEIYDYAYKEISCIQDEKSFTVRY